MSRGWRSKRSTAASSMSRSPPTATSTRSLFGATTTERLLATDHRFGGTMRLAGIFSNLATVETPRLLLRPMSLDDAEDMFAYASDPQVVRFTSWNVHQSIDDTRAFLQHTVDAYR